jgi:hypothetical protein
MHKHSDYLVTRTQKRLNLLKSIKGKNWGASSKTILNTYKALIRPIIEYVPFITLSTAKSNYNKLENIQRKAIRVAIPWPPHTSATTIYNQINLAPLRERAIKLTTKYIKKSTIHNDTFATHSMTYQQKFTIISKTTE